MFSLKVAQDPWLHFFGKYFTVSHIFGKMFHGFLEENLRKHVIFNCFWFSILYISEPDQIQSRWFHRLPFSQKMSKKFSYLVFSGKKEMKKKSKIFSHSYLIFLKTDKRYRNHSQKTSIDLRYFLDQQSFRHQVCRLRVSARNIFFHFSQKNQIILFSSFIKISWSETRCVYWVSGPGKYLFCSTFFRPLNVSARGQVRPAVAPMFSFSPIFINGVEGYNGQSVDFFWNSIEFLKDDIIRTIEERDTKRANECEKRKKQSLVTTSVFASLWKQFSCKSLIKSLKLTYFYFEMIHLKKNLGKTWSENEI